MKDFHELCYEYHAIRIHSTVVSYNNMVTERMFETEAPTNVGP